MKLTFVFASATYEDAMSVEFWTLVIAAGTFLVIAASAYAALAQLRHLNTSNQLNALLFFLNLSKDTTLQEHFRFVRDEYPALCADPKFLASLNVPHVDRSIHRELEVLEWYEEIGALLKHRLINEQAFLDMVCPMVILGDWRRLQPTISTARKAAGPTRCMNFEYLAARSERIVRAFPDGVYPSDTPRLRVTESSPPTTAKPTDSTSRETTLVG